MVQTDTNTVESVQTNQVVGDTAVHKETVVTGKQVDPRELQLAKTNQAVWLIINLISAVIFLRFIFLLFGANISGFALFIYNLSMPFVMMFQGIFPAPSTGGSYFDTAAVLAICIWYLIGYAITYVIAILSNRTGQTTTVIE